MEPNQEQIFKKNFESQKCKNNFLLAFYDNYLNKWWFMLLILAFIPLFYFLSIFLVDLLHFDFFWTFLISGILYSILYLYLIIGIFVLSIRSFINKNYLKGLSYFVFSIIIIFCSLLFLKITPVFLVFKDSSLFLAMAGFSTNINDNNDKIPMTYEKAYEYAVSYGKKEGLDIDRKLKVKTEDRFRFNFNSIDISFDKKDSVLVVRACIERESNPKRDDFIAIIDSLDEEYKNELAGGYLEYDETALEVDGFKPNRFNIRMDFIDASISHDDFYKKTDNLLTAAKKWRNKYYLNIYNELNKNLTWFKKDITQ